MKPIKPLVILCILFTSCYQPTSENVKSKDTATMGVDTVNHQKSGIKPDLSKIGGYTVIKKRTDNRGLVNSIFVYTKDTGNIRAINYVLCGKYKTSEIASLQIYYFDSKKVANNYENILFNKNISDDEVERASLHLIGYYEYVSGSSDELKIGKDAAMQ